MKMRVNLLICAALVAAMIPAAALADDPHDPTMRDPAARALDHAMTRRLNIQESAMVRERDARYAADSQAWHDQGSANHEYTAQVRDQERATVVYAHARDRYDRAMSEWRRAVAACRAGDYSACGG
jgi:hypothetical protein